MATQQQHIQAREIHMETATEEMRKRPGEGNDLAFVKRSGELARDQKNYKSS